MHDQYYLFVWNVIGMLSVRKSLRYLGGILGSCLSGRDVIPWPLLVGVHGGAPSV